MVSFGDVCLFVLVLPSQLSYRSHSSINKLLPQLYVTSSADQFGERVMDDDDCWLLVVLWWSLIGGQIVVVISGGKSSVVFWW